MVTHSTVERHTKTSTSLTSTSSSSSSSSSTSSPPLPRHHPSHLPLLRRPETEQLQLLRDNPDRCPPAALPRPLLDPVPFPDPAPVPAPPPAPLAAAAPPPTHFPPFRCQEDYRIIMDTASMLERSGFYWGPMGVQEAHRLLQDAPLGSYLVRDSRQKDVFFTLSYRAESACVSVRIVYKARRFGLSGSERSFASLFGLLEHYVASPKRSLTVPYRRRAPTLQELCRSRIVGACGGGEQLQRLSRELPLNRVVHDFLSEFPYKL